MIIEDIFKCRREKEAGGGIRRIEMKTRQKWDNKEELMEMFNILAALKGTSEYIEMKDGASKEWIKHCETAAKLISKKYGKKRSGAQVQMQTLIPTASMKAKFSKRTAENFAYAILSGYVTIHELNKYFFNK